MKKLLIFLTFSTVLFLFPFCSDDKTANPETSNPVTYSLVYDGNGSDGGIVPNDSNSYAEGVNVVTAEPGSMTRTGHLFSAWNTDSNGSGNSYNPGDIFLMPAANMTLYAQWEICAIYVDPTIEPGGDGTYDNPYPSIAYAIAYRGTITEIILLQGTYNEQVDFGGADLYIHSESGALVTIINPSIGGDVVTFSSGETVNAILEDVTITGGTSHGINIVNSSPTIRNCIINGNSSTTDGGGIYASVSNGVFLNNVISNNTATQGAGLYISDGEPNIRNNWIESNTASSYGGGVFLNSQSLLANNIFILNSKESIFLECKDSTDYDTSYVINNTIVDSSDYGIYIDNYYYDYNYIYSRTIVANNIIYNTGSYAVYYSGSSDAFTQLSWLNNNVYSTNSYNTNSQTGVNGNISVDPGFTDYSSNDFTLTWSGSTWVIDGGLDASIYGVTDDRDGVQRPGGLGYDMGAYESF